MPATDVSSLSGAESEADAESESDTAGLASEVADSPPAITAAKAELDMDTKAELPNTSGRKATAASATKKMIRKTGKVEKFNERSFRFGTLGEHAASHDYPKHVTTCGACLFWKHRSTWSHKCSHRNPVSQEMVTWLGCVNGLAVCTICAAHKGIKHNHRFCNGVASFLRLNTNGLAQHGATNGHKAARWAWQERLRVESTQGEIV